MKKFILSLLLFSFAGFRASADGDFEHKKSPAERIEEIRNLPSEEKNRLFEEALTDSERICYSGKAVDITYPEIFCPCEKRRLQEILTEQLKEYYIIGHILRGVREWYENKDYDGLRKYYRSAIYGYCRDTVGGAVGGTPCVCEKNAKGFVVCEGWCNEDEEPYD